MPPPTTEGPLAALTAVRALIREWIIPFYALAGVVSLVLYGVLLVDPRRLLATGLLLALASFLTLMLVARRSRLAARSALLSRPALVFVGLTLLMYAIGFAFTGVVRPSVSSPGVDTAAGPAPSAVAPGVAASAAAVAEAAAAPAAAQATPSAARPDAPGPRQSAAVPVAVPAAVPAAVPINTRIAAPALTRAARQNAPGTSQAVAPDPACGRLLLKLSLGETLDASDQALLGACRATQ